MMQINIKIMSEEAYKTLQKNYKEVTQMIINHPSDCSWLNEYLGFEPFEEKKYVIEMAINTCKIVEKDTFTTYHFDSFEEIND